MVVDAAPGLVGFGGGGDVVAPGLEVPVAEGDLVFGGFEGLFADGHGGDAGAESGTVGAGLAVDEEGPLGGFDDANERLELFGRGEAVGTKVEGDVVDAERMKGFDFFLDDGRGFAAEVEDGSDVVVADPGAKVFGVGLGGTIDLSGDDDVEVVNEEGLIGKVGGEREGDEDERNGDEPEPTPRVPRVGGLR